jgi:hypothetical protein
VSDGRVDGIDSAGKSVPIDDPSAVEWRLYLGYLQVHTGGKKWENRYLTIPRPELAADVQKLIARVKEQGRSGAFADLRELIRVAEY